MAPVEALRAADAVLDHLPSEGGARRRGAAWRPHRSLATAYLYDSLWAAPIAPEGG